ncbi:hypothetical protein [Goodfellowiella coeruleoviolacea]|uniref:Uncharacterized protein n=1 Tax=Goodfellowiella coeruleoviolacea TaxID=334858 RepID=A0AAE3KK63_9PSEU|nr:hypothetical protein [Goodfellowiella coeruleoviolacea]MCP2165098.1 hypothetical protein [Goodfellowiella coeruleoviolacea]
MNWRSDPGRPVRADAPVVVRRPPARPLSLSLELPWLELPRLEARA